GGDRRHVLSVSAVVESPKFANSTLRLLGSGWQLSGILKLQSGTSFTVNSGTDVTLTGTSDNQRALQILANPYMPNKNRDQWLNPAAFARPANGQYGNAAKQHSRTGNLPARHGANPKVRDPGRPVCRI